jgi:TIR domain
MQYLRDVHFLRSGEEWNPAILKKIEEADIFQLCWSSNTSQSPYVEQEWRHALLHQARPSFIRPVYWETPMPAPPPELAPLHFAYLPLAATL